MQTQLINEPSFQLLALDKQRINEHITDLMLAIKMLNVTL